MRDGLSGTERRELAAQAAIEVAARFGLGSQSARVLKDSNNTLVHLSSASIVAKVGTSTIRRWDGTTLEREISVASHLASKGAPSARPTVDPPSGPHRSRIASLLVSLWQFYEQTHPVDLRAASFALRAVHDALKDYSERLPTFKHEFYAATELLRQDGLMPKLPGADRPYLQGVGERLRQRLDVVRPAEQPLHGAPHSGNLLQTSQGPLWIDFETACLGPVEWDLAGFPDRAKEAFPIVDDDLLETLRLVRSFTVSAKCWAQFGRPPEVDEAARFHLRLLHEKLP